MLRLPRFGVVSPASVEEAIAALATPGARLVAGGTDLLPNLKHRLAAPPLLVSLARLPLRYLHQDGDAIRIGAGVTLAALARDPLVAARLPSLARAAGLVAAPTIRNLATIGGNLHLDTRCRYVNQSRTWRDAIGGCLKSEGDRCHVVPGGQTCVAALSADCVPVLISLGAAAVLVGPRGARTVALADYYRPDGTAHVAKAADELMTEVRVPLPAGPRRATYAKWTVRRSIDFPLVSVAMCFGLDADAVDAGITDAVIVVGVLHAAPRRLRRTEVLHGQRLSDPATADALADLLTAQCRPLDNVPYDADYRRRMAAVHARRALAALVAAG
jgi:4-hydroxybenzoyl-CoA reductase subunit beta